MMGRRLSLVGLRPIIASAGLSLVGLRPIKMSSSLTDLFGTAGVGSKIVYLKFKEYVSI